MKRPDGTLVTGTAIGGTAFTSLDISFTISGSAAVGDVVKIRSKPFSEIAFPTSALAEDVWIENNYVHDNVGKAAGDAVYVEGVGGICAVIGNLIPAARHECRLHPGRTQQQPLCREPGARDHS
ncbi:hypothetical protein GCM10020258_12230 [Sphingomonas yabuuchiae]